MGNSSTTLITSYFKTFFDLVRPSMNKDIEHLMTNILSNLVDECDSLPTPVIETIVAQFTRRQPPKDKKKDQPDLTTFGSGGYPAAYFMAKSICQDCADHMSRDVATYFADVLVPDSSDDEEVDLDDLTKSHHLVYELYLASPHILSNTIPLLEAELQHENTDVRVLAVECVGKMAGARISSANFTITYSSCWNIWLARRNDKSPVVRVKWLESLPDIFANNLEVVSDVAGSQLLLFQSDD
jgi:sister chromatid cohesion protein PDS5